MRSFAQKYHITPIFCLLLVLMFFYFPVLFLGRTLQGPEMARMDLNLKAPPSPEAILHIQVAPQIFNTEQVTATNERFPYDIYLGKKYRSFQLPLWNSHQGIGFPFAAQYETSAFFPLRIIQVLFPSSVRDWFFILNIWLAGIFTYLFFFATGLNRISAFWGASLYMGSGVFSWFIQLQDYISVAMMLPLVMLATYSISNGISGKNIAFLGLATGCILLAGQPEAAFFALILCASFYFFRLFSSNDHAYSESTCGDIVETRYTHPCRSAKAISGFRRFQKNLHRYFPGKHANDGRIIKLKNLLGYAVGNLLGFFIASPLLLPFIQLTQRSFTIHSADLMDNHVVLGIAGRTKLYQIPAIIFPKLLDFPIMPAIVPDTGSWDFLGGYLSIIPFFLLSAGCFVRHQKLKKQFLFFLFFGVFFILFDLGAWPFGWIGYLPFFRQVWSPRWGGVAWSFALISASTYGFYFLQSINLTGTEWKHLIKKVAFIIFMVTFFCFGTEFQYTNASAIFVLSAFLHPLIINMVNYIFALACVLLLIYIVAYHRHNKRCWTACTFLLIMSLWYWLSKGDLLLPYFYGRLSIFNNLLVTKSISIVVGLLLIASVLLYLKGRKKVFLLAVAIIFSIAIIENRYVFPGYPQYQSIEKETPFIKFLKERSGNNRLFALNGILTPSYASVYGLYDIRFLNALSITSYQYFVEKYIKEQKNYNYKNWFDANYFLKKPINENNQYIVHFRSDFLKAINLLGVKYIISSKKQDLEWIKKVYPTWMSELKLVYTDPFVYIYENTGSLPRAFFVNHYFSVSSYQEAQKIAMSENVDIKKTAVLEKPIPAGIDNNASLIGTAKISVYQDENVIINTVSDKPAMLVLTDSYYPGWTALMDGKKTEIYRVDGLVRGVFVPAGVHEIQFYYLPGVFILGLILLSLSLVLCIFFILKK